jgi:hypothetical protein
MRRLAWAVLYVVAVHSRADEAAVLDKDFRILMEWLPGVYDNQEQVYFEEEQAIPQGRRHQRIRQFIERTALPTVGQHVFTLRQQWNDDPAQVAVQARYSFRPDYARNAIRMTTYLPNDSHKATDSEHSDPERLTPHAAHTASVCDVLWTRRANHFTGSTTMDACANDEQRAATQAIIDHHFLLTDEALWMHEGARNAAHEQSDNHSRDVPVKLLKARRFECWMTAMRRDGEWTFQSGLEIYDQGGMVWLSTDEADPQQVGIKMRNVRWPYDPNRPSLVLYAHRPDEDRAVSYAWADPSAERIGINLRWMQASCTLAQR